MNDEIINLYKSIGTSNQESKSNKTISSFLPSNIISSSINSSATSDNLVRSTTFTTDKGLKRSLTDTFISDNLTNLKRKREKCNKGLRHFSMKVCEKVKQKSVTSYNEVADELVNEYCGFTSAFSTVNEPAASLSSVHELDYWSYDQKNVRRRVYDALNVLMAMNIISKEKKEIKWIGLPCNKKQECHDFEAEKKRKQEAVESKSEYLKELILEQIALKSLIERNKNSKESQGVSVPFVVLSTARNTHTDITVSTDRKEYLVQFDNTFTANSHVNVLKNINLTLNEDKGQTTSEDNLKVAAGMLPRLFRPYVKQIAANNKIETIFFSLNLPCYSGVLRECSDTKAGNKDLRESPKSVTDQGNESSVFEEDDEKEMQMVSDGENESDDLDNEEGQGSDEENSSKNCSFTHSLSF